MREPLKLLVIPLLGLVLLNLVGCSTPPPTLKPSTSPEVLEVKVTLNAPPMASYTDESSRKYYGVVVVGLNLDLRPIAINLITWDEIFSWFGGFSRFHRVTTPDENPDPEAQWSYDISMPDSFVSSNQVVFRLSLPDDLVGKPERYRMVVFTRISPDNPPVKVTETFTYYPVDTLGSDLEAPEYIDFYPDNYVVRDDPKGDFSMPFPEVSSDMYNSLDITRVEVRILSP